MRQLEQERYNLANDLVRRQGRQDVHRVYELVNANQADVNVRTMCRVLKISASGYYAWRDRPQALANVSVGAFAKCTGPRRGGASGVCSTRDV